MKIENGVLLGVEFGDELLEKGNLSIKDSTGIHSIAPFCFEGNNEVIKFKCSDNIKHIGPWAFYDSDIRLIDFSNNSSLKEISEGTFNNCASLSVVRFSENNSIERIGDLAFSKCQMLTGVRIPEGVKYIGKNAFYDCKDLIYVHLPNSVRVIDDGAFEKCKRLEEFNLPRHIEKIGNDVLNNTKVKRLTVYNIWPDFKGKIVDPLDRDFEEVTIKDRETRQKFTIKAEKDQNIKISYDGRVICGLYNKYDVIETVYYIEDGKLICSNPKDLKRGRNK